MAVERFGHRVHHYVGAEFYGALIVGAHERVVDDQHEVMLFSYFSARGDIRKHKRRIGGRFDI